MLLRETNAWLYHSCHRPNFAPLSGRSISSAELLSHQLAENSATHLHRRNHHCRWVMGGDVAYNLRSTTQSSEKRREIALFYSSRPNSEPTSEPFGGSELRGTNSFSRFSELRAKSDGNLFFQVRSEESQRRATAEVVYSTTRSSFTSAIAVLCCIQTNSTSE